MRKIKIEDIQTIKKYAQIANYNEYNSNVVTMIMWNHCYEILIEEHEHYLLILVDYHHHCAWLMPLCEKKYRKEALQKMQEISQERHIPFEIHAMIKEFKEYCEEEDIPFVYHYNRDAQDYVYDIHQHKTLIGKKMQKRRNHFNAFLKDFENRYVYVPLTQEHESEVMSFLEEWKAHHNHEESIAHEIIGIQTLFTYFNELDIQGGCIYIDGKLEAFSMYSQLSEDTIQMHVEKANRSIRGLYVALLKHTLMHADEKYQYLNREDDLGEPELRKAKMDLKPIQMIERYTAYFGTTSILQPTCDDLFQIKKLWLESFPDENEKSTNFFFEHLFHLEDTYCLVHHNLILCMLQVRKIPISLNNQTLTAGFIVGVATHPYYKKCGYMKQLLTHVLQHVRVDSWCLQAYNWDLYRSFGFHEAYLLKRYEINPTGLNEMIDICQDSHHLLHLYHEYVKNKDGYRIRDLNYYENYFIPYTYLEGNIYANDQAYIVVYETSEEIIIQEAIYLNPESLFKLIHMFHKKVILFTDTSLELSYPYSIVNSMMVKDSFEENNSLFIREFL